MNLDIYDSGEPALRRARTLIRWLWMELWYFEEGGRRGRLVTWQRVTNRHHDDDGLVDGES